MNPFATIFAFLSWCLTFYLLPDVGGFPTQTAAHSLHHSPNYSEASIGVDAMEGMFDARSVGIVREPTDSEEVELIMRTILQELLRRHDSVRHWEPENYPDDNTAQPTGRTALVVLAMLEAGQPAQSEKLQSALRWMAANPADGTYAIAVRLMVWCRLPEQYRELAGNELARLMNRFSVEAGGWDYIPTPRAGYVDQSVTQYALQGIADAHNAGFEIPPALINMVRNRFLAQQTEDGGWGYKTFKDPARGSLTAAGLASLALCEQISPSKGSIREAVDRSIAGSIDWLDLRFARDVNPGHIIDGQDSNYWLFYWLHSLERAGRATGLRRFRGQDWLEACTATIKDRMIDGNRDTGFWIKWSPANQDMAFALFILHRGLEAVPFGLFDTTETLPIHDELGPAARALSDLIESSVGWTRVDLADSPEAWGQIPILVVRGVSGASWVEDPDSPEASRLLEYMRHGGLVVPEPAGRGRFTKELVDLVKQAHPNLLSRKIDSKDEIRTKPTPWRGRAEVLGSPVRPWILTSPKFELGSGSRDRDVEDSARMLAAFCIAETGGFLPPRARRPSVKEAPASRTIRMGRLRHEGDWNPEPAVFTRLADALRSTPVRLAIDADGSLEGDGIVWLSGSTEKDAEKIDIRELADFGAAGRRIIVECLEAEFTNAFTPRLLAEGWTIGPGPADTPPGTARISGPGSAEGLLVTADISRLMMGRPAADGFSMRDMARLLRIADDLESRED